MMATARYQIVHHDVNPVWRKTFVLEIGRPFPENICASGWFMTRRESSKWAQCQMDELARRKEVSA